MLEKVTPKPALQKRLRKLVDAANLFVVSKRLQIGRGHIVSYLAGLPMNPTACRGIESKLAEVEHGLQR